MPPTPSPRAWPFNPQPGPRPPSPEQDPPPPRLAPAFDAGLDAALGVVVGAIALATAFVVLSACASAPALIRPDCGAACCVSSLDPADDVRASVPCDGHELADPALGDACERPDGVIEACAGG